MTDPSESTAGALVPETPTLLIVEDRVEDSELLLLAVKRADLRLSVRLLPDGDEALAYLRGAGQYADRRKYPLPALVLLDIKLPLRSGFEVLEWIKQKSDFRELPVIIFSSSRDPGDINRAYHLGANSYLCKPPEFAILVEMIKALGTFWLHFSVPPGVSADR